MKVAENSTLSKAVRKLVNYWEIDKAILFSIANILIRSLLAGPLVAFLITKFLTPEIQGFYYTFNSILGIQVFIQLGLGVVITQFAAHEWTGLQFDGKVIVGNSENRSRLASLLMIAVRWYGIGSVVFILISSIMGHVFFAHANTQVAWKAPWLVLCILTGIRLLLVPCFSLLEGCGQISSVCGYRAAESLVYTIAICSTLILRLGLWVTVGTSFCTLLAAFIYLFGHFRHFFYRTS